MPSDDSVRVEEAIGSVAEETTRLLEAMRVARATAYDGAESRGSHADTPPDTHADTASEEASGGHAECGHPEHVPMGAASTCTYCPVCRGVDLARSLSPELLDRLAALAGAAAGLLTDIAAQRSAAAASGPRSSGPESSGPAHPAATGAQRIDVVDEEEE